MSNEYEIGRAALQYFHNESARKFPDIYKMKFDQLLEALATKRKKFAEGIGDMIVIAEIPDGKVHDAFEMLAAKSYGKVPTFQDFTNALNGQVGKLSFYDLGPAIVEITKGTIKDSMAIAEKAGNTIIETGFSFMKWLPWILGGLAALIIVLKVRK